MWVLFFIAADLTSLKAAQPDKIVAPQRRPIDEAKASSYGIRKLSGKRLTLYTDVSGEEIDRLPELFDQAFLQYCEYFHVPPDELAGWSMTGFLMKDKSRFVANRPVARRIARFSARVFAEF